MKYRAIYSIENMITHKVYIGSTIDIYGRWADHLKLLRNNKHENSYLQNAWNKYGEENFKFIIIECVSNQINLRNREQYWMDIFHCHDDDFGYNLCPKAGSIYGLKRSAQTCIKIGLSKKGKKHSEDHKKNISEGLKGRIVSQETRRKIANSNTGKRASKELKLKLSLAHIKPLILTEPPIDWK